MKKSDLVTMALAIFMLVKKAELEQQGVDFEEANSLDDNEKDKSDNER